jgi:hypothetical protein
LLRVAAQILCYLFRCFGFTVTSSSALGHAMFGNDQFLEIRAKLCDLREQSNHQTVLLAIWKHAMEDDPELGQYWELREGQENCTMRR